jgi:hypothetical protein
VALSSSAEPQGRSVEAAFLEVRTWVDERLRRKGLSAGQVFQTRQEAGAVTLAHIEQLKADIAALIEIEGRKSFWSGLLINAVFFVLGLVSGVFLDLLKVIGGWKF